jgi:predicted porin
MLSAVQQARAEDNSVTLYGVIDTGIQYVSHAGPGGSGAALQQTTGNSIGTRWGIRGVENLGGGQSVVFVLENGFNSATGAQMLGRFFGRQAWIGLAGDWGSVRFGRQNNILFDLLPPYDPTRYATYGVMAIDTQFFGRADNAIKYVGTFGGLTYEFLYSSGYDSTIPNGAQVPGDFLVGQEISSGATYKTGNLSVALVYDQQRGTSTATRNNTIRRYIASAIWKQGPFSGIAGYRLLQGSTTVSNAPNVGLYWVGANYSVNPALTILGGVYYLSENHSDNSSLSYAITFVDSLSKRTALYLNAAYTSNRGHATTPVALGSVAAPGVSQTGAVVGIRHTF